MDYIKIKGYKSIQDLHLDLKPINILIGANGAGKTNFISFFHFLNMAYNQLLLRGVSKSGGVNKFLHHGRKVTEQLSAKLSFGNGTNHYEFALEVGDTSFVVTKEILGYDGRDWDIAEAKPELQLKNNSLHRANYINSAINALKVYHFHETGAKSAFNEDARINDNYMLSNHGANLASILYALQQNNRIVYNRIVQALQSVAPYFLDFELRPNTPDSEYIRLAWKDKYHTENTYGATDFSDGTIRYLALVTLFLQANTPPVIIIDEPELGLHPFAISKLAGLIKSVAAKGTQVILATQSVELINCFEPEDIITVDNIDGASEFERLDSSKLSVWLDDYTIGDMWKQNILDKGFPNR
ncbi:MAG: hypothetical protein RL662_992 [Bacteroidota bacterium]|jgi:predicted ATPase